MRTTELTCLLVIAACASLTSPASGAPDVEFEVKLEVLVDGASENAGQAIASLFNSSDTYLKNPLVQATVPIDDEGRARFEFGQLETGVYAVSVIYDENSDGELNTGFFGIPKEPVGFSNNVKGKFGPPPFSKTSFELSKSATIIIVLGEAGSD